MPCTTCDRFKPCPADVDLDDDFADALDADPKYTPQLMYAKLALLKPHEVPYACRKCGSVYVRYCMKSEEDVGIWWPLKALDRNPS